MVEIGTVTENYKGELKTLHKVRITWELPLETKVFDQSKGAQPFSISKEYTLSMHEKSNLRKDLSSWRGKSFSDDEANGFDITKLISVPCMINVIHNQAGNGNTYANIAAISPLPKGTTCPDQVNKSFMLSYSDFSMDKYNSLPEWLRTRMSDTPEFKAIVSSPKVDPKLQNDDLPF